MFYVTASELAEVAEVVDAGVVAVGPVDLERVVSDQVTPYRLDAFRGRSLSTGNRPCLALLLAAASGRKGSSSQKGNGKRLTAPSSR